ncbi:MAG TPA: T9SS type A sorting domain-containing protein [Chitinophagaceae bacterium]|nr:T9SS type A sorting domain-containing protein [Chitinophagaceae bacterium]
MKKILLITSIFLLIATYSQGQSRSPLSDGNSSIVRFYPNPATTIITFDFQRILEKGHTIQLYNFLGKKVYEASNLNLRTTINLSDYIRGVYIYQLYDKTGKLVESGKFQVSK